MTMILGIVLGFIGVVFVLQPDTTCLLELYSGLALLGGLLIGISLLVVRRLNKDESPEQVSFFYMITTLALALIWLAFDFQMPPKSAIWWLVAMGISGTIYQQLLVYALKYGHASLVSPLMYSSIAFSAIIEYIFWDMIPNASVWMGFALIFLGSCITVFVQGQTKTLTRK